MRTFLCIPTDRTTGERIDGVSRALRAATEMRASWVPPGNYHLTVRFLGEIDPMATVDLDSLCRRIVRAVPPFSVEFDRIGAFPSLDRARVLWVGGDAPGPYSDLVRSIDDGLEQLGFDAERLRPEVHVTLARVKGRPDSRLPEIVDRMNPLPRWRMPVDRIVLMESRLTRSGAVYAPLFAAPLGGDGPATG